MAAGEIRIDTDVLMDMAITCNELRQDLEASSTSPFELAAVPELASAWSDFEGRWDKARGEITEAIESLAHAFQETANSFDESDTGLADGLQGD